MSIQSLTAEDLTAGNPTADGTGLQTTVKARGGDGGYWTETADVVSFSSSGAGFYVPRYCHVGQLVSLILPLPPLMRCYDHDKALYRVWGLVQHCSPVSDAGGHRFHVGVAYIGRTPPESYHTNALQSYRIAGMSETGLWRVEESDAPFVSRSEPRFASSLNVCVSVLDEKLRSLATEHAVAENISRNGAAVICFLPVSVGERLKLFCEKPRFSGLAVVRDRKIGIDDRPRLHIEFVEDSFPIEYL